MFRFSGTLAQGPYFIALAIRIAAVVAVVAVFPLLLRAFSGGTVPIGMMWVSTWLILLPAGFVLSLIGLCMRRARDGGLPGWAGLFVPLLVAVDGRGLMLSEGLGSFGYWFMLPPRSLFAGLALAVVLGFLRPAPGRLSLAAFGFAGVVAAVLAAVVAAWGVLTLTAFVSGLGGIWRVTVGNRPVDTLVPYLLGAFVAASAIAVLLPRRDAQLVTPRETKPWPSIPVWWLGALAFALALIAFAIVNEDGDLVPMLTLGFVHIVLPTFVLYFAAAIALYLVIRRPSLPTIALAIVVALPFGSFALSHLAAMNAEAADAAEVAALPRHALVDPPSIVVTAEGVDGWPVSIILESPGIGAVIQQVAPGRLYLYSREPGGDLAKSEVFTLPLRYLLLRMGKTASLKRSDRGYRLGSPFELWLFDGAGEHLVAVWRRAYVPRPAALPVVRGLEWFSSGNFNRHGDINDAFRAFFADAMSR